MLEKIQFVKPEMIEARSMEMITKELKGRTWPEPEFSVVKRRILTMRIIFAFPRERPLWRWRLLRRACPL